MPYKRHILIADDQPAILLVLEEMLEERFEVHAFADGRSLLDYVKTGGRADLVLTDVMMPEVDGFEVCRQLKADAATRDIPILFLSSLESDTDEAYGLSLGAEDFIHKPFSPPVVLARVRNHLALADASRQLLRRNEELEELVAERTREVVRRGQQLINAQDAIITALCTLAEVRDNETGNHILRTQAYVGVLARALQGHPDFAPFLDDEAIALITKSAALHDVGKVAIPDAVLLKPGRLDAEERLIIQSHCAYGRDAIAKAIAGATADNRSYLDYALEIAYSHHERWDGEGYPQGLRGAEIPMSARLMAVADVYDALISRRVYKPAIPHSKVVAIIAEERGRQFDPDMVDAFLRVADQFEQIAVQHRDAGAVR
ncbi:HD domain-containing phosphohydrolase [Zoogloea sp. LCSB751]|uniref:HD domain-containing phosphohydrolase n=1 Tax=Zoogloea sp. LCSB751 TaxID=1965277 RepID=UPI0009A49902|nr:HD domain-containing phosphohydrolase [Zoogloea sp. LCSB751]